MINWLVDQTEEHSDIIAEFEQAKKTISAFANTPTAKKSFFDL